MNKRRVIALCVAIFAFGVGISASAVPINCQSCYTNYNNCMAHGGSDCGTQFKLCFDRVCA